jgi:hypothetical protein
MRRGEAREIVEGEGADESCCSGAAVSRKSISIEAIE